jgi:hypothetical protein
MYSPTLFFTVSTDILSNYHANRSICALSAFINVAEIFKKIKFPESGILFSQ